MLEGIGYLLISVFVVFLALPWLLIILSPVLILLGLISFPIFLIANKSISKMKILIADDDEVSIAPLLAVLKHKKIPLHISYFSSGEAALRSLKHSHYDLVILDYYMPGITGLDILSKAEVTKKMNSSTPVVFYTGYADILEPVNKTSLHKFTISDVWAKSLNFTSLDQKIGNFLSLAS